MTGARRVVTVALVAALGVAARAEAASPVQFRTSDGVTIAATWYEAGDTAPAVVLVPMYTRTREDWRAFAEKLNAAGLSALSIDLRGHGGSGGAAAPAAAMALDVRAAIDFLAGRPGVRGIAVAGASLGASAAVLAAADASAVRGLALLSLVSDYRGVRIDAAVRKYGGRPMFLVASTDDPLAARTLRGLVADPATAREQRLSLVAAHGTVILERDPDVAAALVDWLRRTLLS